MFDQVGWGELTVILLLALFVFGPERLPGIASDVGKALRQFRTQLRGLSEGLKSELGPELGSLDLQTLHPRSIVTQLWESTDEPQPAGVPARPRGSLPLGPGELAPWDPDTT